MKSIEQIKHEGAVKALIGRIHDLQFKLSKENWNNIESNGTFCRMEKALKDADNILTEMCEVFTELIKMESAHK